MGSKGRFATRTLFQLNLPVPRGQVKRREVVDSPQGIQNVLYAGDGVHVLPGDGVETSEPKVSVFLRYQHDWAGPRADRGTDDILLLHVSDHLGYLVTIDYRCSLWLQLYTGVVSRVNHMLH